MNHVACVLSFFAALCLQAASIVAQEPTSSSAPSASIPVPISTDRGSRRADMEAFAAHAQQLRENAQLRVEPQVIVPPSNRTFSRSAWKDNIVTAIFSIGEPGDSHSSSAWNPDWQKDYGGFDDPDPKARKEFLPSAFSPGLNPFYVALPYNDVTKGVTKPEARVVIPWFNAAFQREGISVCRDHWVAIRKGNRICYAQWSDSGPFRSDHFQYVFGNERPLPNALGGAGMMVSPAVRDYLGMGLTRDVCSWRFAEVNEIPSGPWRLYGKNNTFVARRLRQDVEP